MKNILIFIIAIFLISGCSSFYEGDNVSPNLPTEVNPDNLLRGVQLANIQVQLGQSQRVTGMWCGQYRGVILLYLALHEYNLSSEESNDTWNLAYQSVVKQSRLMREGLKDDAFYQGVGKIMEAHALGTLAILYGDIPFSEISQDEKFPNPKFDSQKAVFEGLQVLLDEAIADLRKITVARSIANDLLFTGNHTRWLEVAHTLKSRYYMETRNYTKAAEAAARGVSNSLNSLRYIPPAINGIGDGNLINMMIANRGGYMSTTNTYLTTLLGRTFARGARSNAKTTEDARAKYYRIVGTSSTTERGVAARNAPMPLVIFEENVLNLAECATRAGSFDEGLRQLNRLRAHLNTRSAFTPLATTDTLRYDPYVEADFLAGGIENRGTLTKEQALLREILEERYVSLYGQILPFSDLRRLTKTNADLYLTIPFNTATVNRHPERLIYAQTEINANPNVPKPLPGIYEPTEVNR
jgi:starch-binding outer membrane protein, SusD/RagB family